MDFSDPRYVEYVSKMARALEAHLKSLDPKGKTSYVPQQHMETSFAAMLQFSFLHLYGS